MSSEVVDAKAEKLPKTKDEIVVREANDWPVAADVSEERSIKSSVASLKFKLRAISYGEEAAILERHPDPEQPVEERGRKVRDDNEFQRRLGTARFYRLVEMIDLCWNKIPGENIDDKVRWAQDNLFRGGDLLGLQNEIHALSGYGQAIKESQAEAALISKPEDWANATKAPTSISFKRSGKTLVFIARGISGAKVKQIEIQTDPGPAPMAAMRALDGGRRVVRDRNPEAPEYKKRCREMAEFRNVLMLEAGLGFNLPGETSKDKMDWLAARPAGEVSELITFVQIDALGYREQVDFL